MQVSAESPTVWELAPGLSERCQNGGHVDILDKFEDLLPLQVEDMDPVRAVHLPAFDDRAVFVPQGDDQIVAVNEQTV